MATWHCQVMVSNFFLKHLFIFLATLAFFLDIYSSIRLHCVLVAACRLFVVAPGPLLCQSMGTVVVVHRLSYRKTCEILVPQPGIKPMSPALQSKFLTSEPPGDS